MSFVRQLGYLVPGPWKVWFNFIKPLVNATQGKDAFSDHPFKDSDSWLGNFMKKQTGSGLSQDVQDANAFTAEREDIAWNRELEASNTQIQRTVADARAAGVNPIYALSGSSSMPSASAGSSAAPSSGGLDMASLIQLMSLPLQLKSLKAATSLDKANAAKASADAALATANANKAAADEEFLRYNLRFAQETEELRKESLKIQNELSRKQVDEIYQNIDESLERIKLTAAQTDSELAKKFLIQAQSHLANASAYRVAAMIPYEQALMSAQTDAARATAALNWVNEAYQQKLIDGGFVSYMCDEMKSRASSANSKAVIDDIDASIRNGTFNKHFQSSESFGDVGAGFLAGLANTLSLVKLPVIGK